MSQFDFIEQSSLGAGFVYKNTSGGYVYGVTHFVATTGSGTTVLNISSVTDGLVQVGLTLTGLSGSVTIVSLGTFNGVSGTVNLSGIVTWTDPTTVTGIGFLKITASAYPAKTVRGVVYLDGTYYVMNADGTIYGSEINNPYLWTFLNSIQTIAEPDTAVALFRQLNLIVAFCDYSIEFFYDAANPPPGSPLAPYSSATLGMGCASADSIAQAENTLFFMGKAKQKGRSIYKMEGTKPMPISNSFVDRILDGDDLSNVVSFVLKLKGHLLYCLTLKTTGITLVYDNLTGIWNIWTQLNIGFQVTAENLSWVDGLATMTLTNHQIADGSYMKLESAGNYSGSYVINSPTANTITFDLPTNPGVWNGFGTCSIYTEKYFNIANYLKSGSRDTVQDSTTGFVYALDTGTYNDNINPIKYRLRTAKFDNSNNKAKFYKQLEIIGDKVPATGYICYSDDDYETWSQFRPINLLHSRSKLDRLGQARRRAFDFINYDNQPLRLENLEMIVKEGIH